MMAASAEAQATRTWVSGVGDDANPCSRTAPCKTFAGAISKTALNGEINCLDPGGYGAVTITKSITIDCHEIFAGILNAGTNGINIPFDSFTAVGETRKTVRLRNLNINGANTGLIGISITGTAASAGSEVFVEDCLIDGQFGGSMRGINDTRNGGALFVTNTTIRNVGSSGILMSPVGTALVPPLRGTLSNVRLENNGNAGLALTRGAKAAVAGSVASGNGNFGFYADGVGGSSELTVADSIATSNGTGVNGISGAVVRISNMTITGNNAGVNASGGTIVGFGNNVIDGNTTANGPVTPSALQ
jgi:hypothetical protein